MAGTAMPGTRPGIAQHHQNLGGPQPRQLDELGRISTMPTMLRPLIAIAILPSRVGIMWRTMPPPLGICQVWNFSVLGSNRTRLFGRVFDSTYQILSSITVMPYGWDCGPLGPSHSVTAPVL